MMVGLVVDAALPQQLLELLERDDVARERVAELGRPVPAGGAGHVALVVRGRIDVHLDNADAGVVCMLGYPVGRHKHISHGVSFLFSEAEHLVTSGRLPRQPCLTNQPVARIASGRDL